MTERNENLEDQFNETAADETANEAVVEDNDAVEEADAPQENVREQARQQRAKRRVTNKVVNYADADDELRAKMDALMNAIDADPEDKAFAIIPAYGQEPLQKLREVSARLLQVQGDFSTSSKAMGTSFENVKRAFDKLGSSELKAALSNMVEGGKDAGAKGVRTFNRALKSISETITGKAKKRTEDEKKVNGMIAQLPELHAEMKNLIRDLGKAEENIKKVQQQAVELGQARMEALRELTVYLGTKDELKRRYMEEYITEAKAEYEEDGTLESQERYQLLIRREENVLRQMSVLEQARVEGQITGKQLLGMVESLEQQRERVIIMKNVGEPQWITLLATAEIAVDTLKIAQKTDQMDQLGTKMSEFTMGVVEQQHKMTLASAGKGIVDAKQLLENMGRMQKMLTEEEEARSNQRRKLEEDFRMIRHSSEQLEAAADAAKRRRLLEADPSFDVAEADLSDNFKAADRAAHGAAKPRREAPAPAANDDAEAPATPRRKPRAPAPK